MAANNRPPWTVFPGLVGQAHSRATRYLVATMAVGASAVLRLLLDPWLAGEAPMLAFVVGTAVAALYGGRGPGLYATALSLVVGDYFFVEPRFSFGPRNPAEWARMGLFTFEGIVIAVTAGRVHRHAQELEDEVRRRTGELEASNEALETFAHTVSHDLRAPLRSIRGFAEIIEADYGTQLPHDGQQYTRRISEAAHRLEELVTNLLAYTRLGRSDSLIQPVSLDRVVDQALSTLSDELKSSAGRVNVTRPLGDVMANRDTLELIVLNLLSNAVKFVPPQRHPDIEVWSSEDATLRRLSVRDNGIGVSPEHLDRIFEPFERLHSRGRYPGSGLGLALVKRGTARMGGRCGVASEPGSGSEFWIELPASSRGPG